MTIGINHTYGSVPNNFYKTGTSGSASAKKNTFQEAVSSNLQETGSTENNGKALEGALQEESIFETSDEYFAEHLSIASGEKISTEKEINWKSEGGKELTEEQIAYLKSHYNIRNMGSQDYYNLMSDLTQMNVLSGQDCVNQHVKKVPWLCIVTHEIEPLVTTRNSFSKIRSNTPAVYEEAGFLGNLLEKAKADYDENVRMLESLESSGSTTMTMVSAEELCEYKEYVQSEIDFYRRLVAIYEAIS